MRPALHSIAILALVLLLGLHWTLLQVVAWTGMVVAYSRDNSLREAVSMTLDGDHPCSLCHAVKAGRAADKDREQDAVASGTRLEATWERTEFLPVAPEAGIGHPARDFLPRSRCDSPPTPPPRRRPGVPPRAA